MALLWRTLQQEVRGTVDDIRAKGAIGALREAALDTRDIASDAGTWVWDGVKSFLDEDPEQSAQSSILRCESIPARGATAQLELPDGSTVEALVVDVDGISTPPRARVTVPGKPEPFLVNVLPPGAPREGHGEAHEDVASSSPASLISGFRQEWTATVQEFREKGAVSAVRDAAIDTVDFVGARAKSAVDGARSIASHLDWEPKDATEDLAVARDADGGAALGGSAAGSEGGVVLGPSGSKGDTSVSKEGDAGISQEAGSYAEALWADLKEEWKGTVQDIREKGAVGAVKDATLDAVDIVGSAAAAMSDTTRTYAAPLLERAPDAVASVGTTAAAVAKQTQAYAAPMLERALLLPDLWAAEQGSAVSSAAGAADTCAALAGSSAEAPKTAAHFAPPPRSVESKAAEALSPPDAPCFQGQAAAAPADRNSDSAAPASISSPPKEDKPGKSLVSGRRDIFERPKEASPKQGDEEVVD